MADTTTTGSIVIGMKDGMDNGVLPSGTYMLKPRVLYTLASPNNYVTCLTGSDIAYDIGAGVFYIGDITNGKGGSEWTALKTV
jgi:hypothetical protein